jgi:hypothetical protein
MKALKNQVGGEHYKDYVIQPIEFIYFNNIPFLEANVIKYIVRWQEKNGVQDLEKAKHYIDLLIELNETKQSISASEGV